MLSIWNINGTIRLTFTPRQACTQLYCLHVGPQILPVLLGRHESVCFNAKEVGLYEHGLTGNRQPVMADEIQTFKALITIHKILQEGHPVTVKEGQQNVNWIESLARGVNGEGLRGE